MRDLILAELRAISDKISQSNFRIWSSSIQNVRSSFLFRGFNFRVLPVNRENRENWVPRKFPAIQYLKWNMWSIYRDAVSITMLLLFLFVVTHPTRPVSSCIPHRRSPPPPSPPPRSTSKPPSPPPRSASKFQAPAYYGVPIPASRDTTVNEDHADGSKSSPGSQEAGSPVEVGSLSTPQARLMLTEASMSHWYRPQFSRQDAVDYLFDKDAGSFVVRDSVTIQGGYGLSVKMSPEQARARRRWPQGIIVL